MSFDPFGQQQDPTNQPAPTPATPATPYATPPVDPTIAARDRVAIPGMLLIATATLNLLGALFLFVLGFSTLRISPEEFEASARESQPAQYEQLEKMGYTAEDLLSIYTGFGFYGGAIVLCTAILGIIGGICMLSLRGYGLAVVSALLTAVPCISPMSCPCFFIGTMVGIWCIAVLLSADVRAGFR